MTNFMTITNSPNYRFARYIDDLKLSFDEMSAYINELHNYLDAQKNEVREEYDKLNSELDEKIDSDEYDYLASNVSDFESWMITQHGFSHRLYASFIVSWYSHVEQLFIEFCIKLSYYSHAEDKNNSDDQRGDLNNIKGSPIEYLTKKMKEKQYVLLPKHYQELQHIGEIRNHIVHRQSVLCRLKKKSDRKGQKAFEAETEDGSPELFLDLKGQPLEIYLRTHQLLKVQGSSVVIYPNFEYCQHLIKFAKLLFGKLFEDHAKMISLGTLTF